VNSFEGVYQAYFRDVYSYAFRLCGQKPLAEDLTSDTFLRAMGKIGSFRGECQLRVWLCAITRNLYYSHLRKQGREVLADLLPETEQSEDPAELTAQHATGRQAVQALDRLPEISRRVFMLRVLGGLSFAQIGRLYGKGDNWACVTYHRARKTLKAHMEEETHEPL
jgi:RNA polymerase sigma factor (sigma-70 family)